MRYFEAHSVFFDVYLLNHSLSFPLTISTSSLNDSKAGINITPAEPEALGFEPLKAATLLSKLAADLLIWTAVLLPHRFRACASS